MNVSPAPLREALIEAGLALLEEGGPAGLTLRRAAARAGVSHAAPAHHFHGLPGLMTAMATRAFQTFTAAMQTARIAAPPTPEGQLLGICTGYLDFARQHDGLFHLMFAAAEVNHADPALMLASRASYQELREACAPFAGDARDQFELAVWSMVHGYAALGFSKDKAPGNPYHNGPAFADLLEHLLARS